MSKIKLNFTGAVRSKNLRIARAFKRFLETYLINKKGSDGFISQLNVIRFEFLNFLVL